MGYWMYSNSMVKGALSEEVRFESYKGKVCQAEESINLVKR
jgi:hypothetical protein